jgi:hypothetical protein
LPRRRAGERDLHRPHIAYRDLKGKINIAKCNCGDPP